MNDSLSMTPEMTFDEAADVFTEIKRIQRVSPRTLKDCRQYKKALGQSFAGYTIDSITLQDILAYQRDRQAGATRINHELSFLVMVLKETGCWAKVADHYRPLGVRKSTVGRSLSGEDLRHLLEIAHTRKRWLVAAC